MFRPITYIWRIAISEVGIVPRTLQILLVVAPNLLAFPQIGGALATIGINVAPNGLAVSTTLTISVVLFFLTVVWRLAQKVAELDETLKPNLRFVFRSDFLDFDDDIYTYYVRLETDSPSAVRGVKVNIDSITKDGVEQINFIGSIQQRTTLNEAVDVRHGDPKDFNVVTALPYRDGPIKLIPRCFHANYQHNKFDGARYKFALKAVSDNSSAVSAEFWAWADDAGVWRFELAD